MTKRIASDGIGWTKACIHLSPIVLHCSSFHADSHNLDCHDGHRNFHIYFWGLLLNEYVEKQFVFIFNSSSLPVISFWSSCSTARLYVIKINMYHRTLVSGWGGVLWLQVCSAWISRSLFKVKSSWLKKHFCVFVVAGKKLCILSLFFQQYFCPQGDRVWGLGEEDCLQLKIWQFSHFIMIVYFHLFFVLLNRKYPFREMPERWYGWSFVVAFFSWCQRQGWWRKWRRQCPFPERKKTYFLSP